jgi:hypothetical protein
MVMVNIMMIERTLEEQRNELSPLPSAVLYTSSLSTSFVKERLTLLAAFRLCFRSSTVSLQMSS